MATMSHTKTKQIFALVGAIGTLAIGCVDDIDSELEADETNIDSGEAEDEEPAVLEEEALTDLQIEACSAIQADRCDDKLVADCVGQVNSAISGSLGGTQTLGCKTISDAQWAQLDVIEQYSDDLRDYTGYGGYIPFQWLEAKAAFRVLLGDGSDYNFAKAIYGIFLGVPQGHSSIGFVDFSYDDCYSNDGLVPGRSVSWYGVCARPAGDSSAITWVDELNPLGLELGDRVIRVRKDGRVWQQPYLLSSVRREPVCDAGTPSISAQRDLDAVHLFAHIDEGDEIDVLHIDNTVETIAVPARGDYSTCLDPFRRPSRTKLFETHQREDGIVVVELATLGNHQDHLFPNPLTFQSYRDWNAEAIELINTDLEQYEDIEGLIWDIRGNRGGSAEYGMGLLASLGDTTGGLGNCYARIPESQPAAFSDSVEYPFPYAIFVEDPLPAISFAGPRAIVSDGAAGSAADWMVYRAHDLDIPVFGHATAGAFGYATGGSYVDKSIEATPDEHIAVFSRISGARCLDADGQPLEGRSFIDFPIDFDPSDLAAGIDTQVEAAASHLLDL